jgi:hypothetical protein
VNWIPLAEAKQARYEESHGELDERAVVRLGNAAYAAGLARLMAGDGEAAVWLRRAAARWRESWDLGAAADAWGRPAGALKASLLAGDEPAVEELARWTLELGAATADSPIGRYAGALALLALGRWPEARHVAHPLQDAEGFPRDVGSALAAIAAGDADRYAEAARSVVASFEDRDAYLEDVPVADTALVLDVLARRRGLDARLPASPVLP